MSVTYPHCPVCGTEAEPFKPVDVVDGSTWFLVRHDHNGCSVDRYRARMGPNGQIEAYPLGRHVRFEDAQAANNRPR